MNSTETIETRLNRAGRQALVVGAVALVLCGAGAYFNVAQFFRSYLVAYLFWLGITLGCLALVMLHHLVGGGWGFAVRRLLESGMSTFPVMAVFVVPLLVGLPHLYAWARPHDAAGGHVSHFKQAYLSPSFFTGRTAVFFLLWIVLAFFLARWSLEQDRTAEPGLSNRLRSLSAPGLLIYGFTSTFTSIDWGMSLEPHWFSTIYGLILIIIQALGAMAFVIVVAMWLAKRPPLSELISAGNFHDLGNLLLTFVMLWAYLSFSQYLITWAGNLPEEITWYMSRSSGGWAGPALFLIVFHFAIPFLLLLSRDVKRRKRVLGVVAAALVGVGLVDLHWLIMPAFTPEGPRVHWLDVAAPVGIGGIWMTKFLGGLKGKSLVPLHDPGFQEAEAHEH